MKLWQSIAVAIAIAGVLAAAVVFAGKRFEVGSTWITLALVLIAIGLLVRLFFILRTARSARKAPEQKPKRPEAIEGLEKAMLHAIGRLRNTAGDGVSALEALPWYMVIGPKGSGKTTLLHRSGLHFPYVSGDTDPREVDRKGAGGTKDCDWFISDHAVLIDTAGRYLDEDNAQEWLGFLDLLVQNRPVNPINGLIITVSARDLLGGGEEAVGALAERIRWRADQLIDRLGVNFPVYVILNQCDLIDGFDDYFATLSEEERGAVLGATFSREQIQSAPARRLFEDEMELLEAGLFGGTITRLAQSEHAESRPHALFFPSQLKTVSKRLSRFVELLFRETLHEAPLLRGVYFASGIQEGASLDPYLDNVAPRLDMQPLERAARREVATPRAYFIDKLFSKIIVPDQGLVGVSVARERRLGRRRKMAFVGGAVGVGLTLSWFASCSVQNRGLLRELETHTTSAAEIAGKGSGEFSFADLQALDGLRAALSEMESRQRAHARVLHLGAYHGDKAYRDARQLYLRALKKSAVLPAFDALTQELGQPVHPSDNNFRQYYRRYLAWHTLSRPPRNLSDDQLNAVATCVANYWRDEIWPASSEYDDAGAIFADQLEYASAYAPGLRMPEGPTLAGHSRDGLRRYWSVDAILPSLIEEARSDLPEITVEALANVPNPGLTGTKTLAGAFSRQGWDGPVQDYLDWLDGVQNDNPTLPPLRDSLLARYVSEYERAWLEFLQNVQLNVPPDGLGGFVSRAAAEESPLMQLIEAIDHNTQFDDARLASISKAFSFAHQFVGPESQSVDYLAALAKLKDVPRGPNAATAVPVVAVGDLLDGLRQASPGAHADAIARIMKLPSEAIVYAGTQQATHDLRVAWRQELQRFRAQLHGRFPIAWGSQTFVRLEDFEDFFKPGGRYWSFYEDHLVNFIHEDGSAKDESVRLAEDFLAFHKKAYAMRDVLFRAEDSKASFQFVIQPQWTPRATIELSFGGEEPLRWEQTPQSEQFTWPGSDPSAVAQLSVITNSGRRNLGPKTHVNEWGLIKLVALSAVSTAGTKTTLTWTTDVGATVVCDVMGLPDPNPFKRDFWNLRVPENPL